MNNDLQLSDILRKNSIREVAVVYTSSMLPFLSTLLRDYSVITTRTADIANLFFVNFNIANFISIIPGEYLWTKCNLAHEKPARFEFFEFCLLVVSTLAASIILLCFLGVRFSAWYFIPAFSIIFGYPIGVLNGLKMYFFSRMIQATLGVIMAAMVFVVSADLPNIYFISLVITAGLFLAPVFFKRILIMSWSRIDYKKLVNALLVTIVPYACFYIANSIALSANDNNSRMVIISNRISVYLFTFILMASPVFMNMFKHLNDSRTIIIRYINYRDFLAVLLFVLMGIGVFLVLNSREAGLIYFSFFISMSCSFMFYISKLLFLTRNVARKSQAVITVCVILILVGPLLFFKSALYTLLTLSLLSIVINYAGLLCLGTMVESRL